jgi:hypothetical protein
MAIKITEEKARKELKACRVSLIVCVCSLVAFIAIVMSVDGNFDKAGTVAWLAFLTYWVSGVYFLIAIGRLAWGLDRSVIYYVGGTMLCSSAIFLIAHLIAYLNISRAVSKTFGEPYGTKPAAV